MIDSKFVALNGISIIRINYLPASNTAPSRLKLTKLTDGSSVTFFNSSDFSHIADQAYFVIASLGINIIGKSFDCKKKVDYLVTEFFNSSLKELLK